MKRYTLSFAQALEHRPQHPERTAKRSIGSGMNFDVAYQVWPNRPSMARSIRMQESGEDFTKATKAWKAIVPLTPGEGY